MEKVTLTLREKIGTVMTSSGIGLIMLGLLILMAWLFTPQGTSFPNKYPVALIFTGIVLIRLSLLTVKK